LPKGGGGELPTGGHGQCQNSEVGHTGRRGGLSHREDRGRDLKKEGGRHMTDLLRGGDQAHNLSVFGECYHAVPRFSAVVLVSKIDDASDGIKETEGL